MTKEELQQQLAQVRSPEKKVEIHLQACRDIQYDNPSEALEYATLARNIARKAKLTRLEIHSQRMQGICAYAANDFEESVKIIQRTLPKYRKQKDKSGLARAYQNIGMALRGAWEE